MSQGQSSGERMAEELAGAAREGGNLLREEVERAREEEKRKLVPIAGSTAAMVAGGVLAGYGFTYLLQACVRLLATRMPLWRAATIVGGGLVAGGGALVALGATVLRRTDVMPRETMEHLGRRGEAILRQTRSNLRR